MKRCKDYAYTGVECCHGCHLEATEMAAYGYTLITIQIDGETAYVCCEIADFFYPNGDWKDDSPTGQWST